MFVLAQRLDRLTFDSADGIPLRGAVDESSRSSRWRMPPTTGKQSGMNGSGFVEMLARQMTADLQAERDATPPGTSRPLISKGVTFGILTHNLDGTWNTFHVEGLPAPSLSSQGARAKPGYSAMHQARQILWLLSDSSATTP